MILNNKDYLTKYNFLCEKGNMYKNKLRLS